jgi:hypothetical protein
MVLYHVIHEFDTSPVKRFVAAGVHRVHQCHTRLAGAPGVLACTTGVDLELRKIRNVEFSA